MNLQTTISVYAGGMGSGCRGPNCGRKKVDVEDAFEKINKVYRAVASGREVDKEDQLNANYAARELLKLLMDENKMYMHDKTRFNQFEYQDLQKKYRQLRNILATDGATLTALDQAVNVMHVDYNALQHWIWEAEDSRSSEGLSEKEENSRNARLEKMAEFFQEHRIGAIKK